MHLLECVIKNTLQINDSKTEFIVFRSPQTKQDLSSLSVYVSDSIIQQSSKMVDRGVIFDQFLSFDDYISSVCRLRNIGRIRHLLSHHAVAQLIQGGVLSHIFFTIYIVKLLVMLRTKGIGCHIGSAYIGALSYADDTTLQYPSIRGLNEMIVLCCEYAEEYDITFNPKKITCIKFGIKININEHVSMNGFTVQWSESVRHLVNFLTLHCLTRWIADTNDKCL